MNDGFYWLQDKSRKDTLTIGLKYNNYWYLIGSAVVNDEKFIIETFSVLSPVQLLIQENNNEI